LNICCNFWLWCC